jgi:hypothetical protein
MGVVITWIVIGSLVVLALLGWGLVFAICRELNKMFRRGW